MRSLTTASSWFSMTNTIFSPLPCFLSLRMALWGSPRKESSPLSTLIRGKTSLSRVQVSIQVPQTFPVLHPHRAFSFPQTSPADKFPPRRSDNLVQSIVFGDFSESYISCSIATGVLTCSATGDDGTVSSQLQLCPDSSDSGYDLSIGLSVSAGCSAPNLDVVVLDCSTPWKSLKG